VRWSEETAASIEAIAEVAAQLADLPVEPALYDRLRERTCGT
jgi:hypothetical protein